MIEAGAEYVRFTAQGEREARNLGVIRKQLSEAGYTTPLVADIHFTHARPMLLPKRWKKYVSTPEIMWTR